MLFVARFLYFCHLNVVCCTFHAFCHSKVVCCTPHVILSFKCFVLHNTFIIVLWLLFVTYYMCLCHINAENINFEYESSWSFLSHKIYVNPQTLSIIKNFALEKMFLKNITPNLHAFTLIFISIYKVSQ